jgi:transcriptional regulator with XRE-family HTH domain
MNRIAKLREQRGLSQADLAKKIRTSQPQIQRLEAGERQLTEDWMRRIARALDVEPADLLAAATRAEFENELQAYLPEASDDLAKPLKARNLRYFKAMRPSVELAGVPRGKIILVDFSPTALKAVRTGDLVAVQLTFPDGESVQLLRQFIAPSLLTTNRRGRNTSFSFEGEQFEVALRGVVVDDTQEATT